LSQNISDVRTVTVNGTFLRWLPEFKNTGTEFYNYIIIWYKYNILLSHMVLKSMILTYVYILIPFAYLIILKCCVNCCCYVASIEI
jgi:hypothetical protein